MRVICTPSTATATVARTRVVVARLVAEIDTGVKGASGLCHLPGGHTLVVDDDKGIALMSPGGGSTARPLITSGKDLEGICACPDGTQIWVVLEGARRVERYDVEHTDGSLQLIESGAVHKLPKFKDDVDNKGWEGLTFLPAALANGTDHLVCVHEAHPRRIGIFALPDLEHRFSLKLPKDAKTLLPDLADVAVDDHGHLFIVSDEGRRVVEFALVWSSGTEADRLLDAPTLVTLSSFELPLEKNSKPEGLAFDADGRLWVSLDNDGMALVFQLER